MLFLAWSQKYTELCGELNLLIMFQKPFLLLLIALFMTGFSTDHLAGAASVSSYSEEGGVEIIVQPREGFSPTAPRMPSAVRIEAYYDEALSSVCSFLTNAGTSVAVELSNLDTGETTSCSIPGSGFSATPISGTSGTWILTYTLLDGSVYEGSFVL